ncbi:GNAT family N-acetyltransferase [Micromonospora sp. CPCC 206060]|uniref:GNAT family N-acetyltransferase n=1 Tax=Micromonospora sp. CPCC 206060 TaxID=3122406 RepID=UPI002FEE7716
MIPTMRVRAVHDRDELAALLRHHPTRHAYELGDLDDPHWPHTTWYRHHNLIALLYHPTPVPSLLAFAAPEQHTEHHELLTALAPLLPRRLHAHLSPGNADALRDAGYHINTAAPFLRLALTDPTRLPDPTPPRVETLTTADLPRLHDLFQAAYAGTWFDPALLHAGQYVGVRHHDQLVAVAGVHVYSPTHSVAALGNVTTHPTARRRGLARATVGALCARLRHHVDHIALNVAADNHAALALYHSLGFTPVAEFTDLFATVD